MKKRRGLGAVSHFVAFQEGLIELLDSTNATSSVISAAFERRLDDLEDSNTGLVSSVSSLSSSISSVSGNVATLTSDVQAVDTEVSSLSSSVSTVIGDVSTLSSSVTNINTEITSLSSSITTINTNVASLSSSVSSSVSTINTEIASLSSSLASLSSSFALLSASIGSGGGIAVSGTAELSFNGDTLLTDADVYISGSGNNLYLHGTNDQGEPAKFEFSIVNGGTIIQEVPHTDFGDEVDDPWFKFDGDTLLTHADIYVSGSNNYLYLNGTDENGDYGIFYFDIVSGSVIVKQTGSV